MVDQFFSTQRTALACLHARADAHAEQRCTLVSTHVQRGHLPRDEDVALVVIKLTVHDSTGSPVCYLRCEERCMLLYAYGLSGTIGMRYVGISHLQRGKRYATCGHRSLVQRQGVRCPINHFLYIGVVEYTSACYIHAGLNTCVV